MSVLLPLYTFPWPGVWDPLYWEASKNPRLNFTVVLNPCSGPCLDALPAQAYIDEVPKLAQYANIRTLGYVATNYTDKPLDSTIAEIHRWAAWPELLNNKAMKVDGIFFDETPGLYHWQKHDYLKLAADEIRKTDSKLGQKIVVHNPGTLPDHTWNYLDIADITVIFEDTFANFISAPRFNAIKDMPRLSNYSIDAFSMMIHSMGNIPSELTQWVAEQTKDLAGWNYATSVSQMGEWWHSFPDIFDLWTTEYAKK